MILGLDLGGTNLRVGLVARGAVQWSEKVKTKSVFTSGNGIADLVSTMRGYVAKAAEPLEAIVMGFPGTVARDNRTVLAVTNVGGLDNINFDEICQREFGVMGIADADVNLLLRDHLQNMNATPKVACAFYLGTGLGNAIAIDGKVFKGAHGVAGELGHIPFGSGEYPCNCGLPYCVEPDISGMALVRLAKASGGSPSDFLTGCSHQLEAFLEGAARVIASEVNILDPDALILGGGVFEMDSFPKRELEVRVRRHLRRPLPHDDVTITWCNSDVATGLRGAWVLHQQITNEN